MRNLLDYPVTYDEKINLLMKYATEYMKKLEEMHLCGDIEGAILFQILKDVNEIHSLRQAQITQPKDG